MVVEKQAETQQPGRAQAGVMWQNEAQRPYDMRRDAPQHLALLQRLSHQAKLVMLQIAQPAMHQFGGGGRGRAAEVGLFGEQDAPAPSCRVARNASAVDATADDGDIVELAHGILPSRFAAAFRSQTLTDFAGRWIPPALP